MHSLSSGLRQALFDLVVAVASVGLDTLEIVWYVVWVHVLSLFCTATLVLVAVEGTVWDKATGAENYSFTVSGSC